MAGSRSRNTNTNATANKSTKTRSSPRKRASASTAKNDNTNVRAKGMPAAKASAAAKKKVKKGIQASSSQGPSQGAGTLSTSTTGGDKTTGRGKRPTAHATKSDGESKNKTRKETYINHAELCDPRGDLEIRSRDGILFKVHRYALAQTCNLIADMQSLPTDPTQAHSMDLDYDHSTIERFLGIANTKFIQSVPRLSTQDAQQLLGICDYFICEHGISLARDLLCDSMTPVRLLRFASENGDDEYMIRQALPRLQRQIADRSRHGSLRHVNLERELRALPARYHVELLIRIQHCGTIGSVYDWVGCDWMKTETEVVDFISAVKGAASR